MKRLNMDDCKTKHHLDNLEKHDVENGPHFALVPPEPDRQIEKQVVHKLDWRLAPLYFIAYLDRSNISNAAVAGITTSIRLTGP